MKKLALGLLLGLCCFALLTACGRPQPPSEKEIANSLSDEIKSLVIKHRISESDKLIFEEDFARENPADVYETDVRSVSIEKRQTNEKEDIVYCEVALENTYYACTKYLKLSYNYYDQGGWILDGWSEYATSKLDVKENPIKSERIVQILEHRGYTSVDDETVDQDLGNGVVQFAFEVKRSCTNGWYEGTAIVTCQFDGTSWSYALNNDDVQFVWDLVGRWGYRKVVESWSGEASEASIVVTIQRFDPERLTMEGTWEMRYLNSEVTIPLNDTDQVEIREVGGSPKIGGRLVLLNEATGSYVTFYSGSTEGQYGKKFGLAELVRTEP